MNSPSDDDRRSAAPDLRSDGTGRNGTVRDCRGPGTSADAVPQTDGGAAAGFDEAALYGVVREAVEDAILGVIGTLLLVGVAAVIVWAGVGMMTRTGDPTATVLGGLVAALGLYLGAVTLGVVPPVRDRF